MIKMAVGCGFALLVGALYGCASPGPTDRNPYAERPWGKEDDSALAELIAVARETPPASEESLEAVAAPMPGPSSPNLTPGSLLEIYVFNIGQADSMLVIGPAPGRKTLLIDLGEPTQGSKLPPNFDSSARHVLERIQSLTGLTGHTHVDYFVLTHYHSDHAGFGAGSQEGWGTGIISLLSDFSVPFSVGEFIHVGVAGAEFMPSKDDRKVYKTIQKRIPIWKKHGRIQDSKPPRFGTTQIDLGPGVIVDILAFAGRVPSGTSAFDRAIGEGVDYSVTPGNENDLSIALEISAGDFELFTAGDLNGTDDPVGNEYFVLRDWGEVYTNIEHHLVAYWGSSGIESDVEIYRANHHGSGFSTTEKLLEALDPEFILYSTGADHGHPSNTVVQRGANTARQLATTWVTDYTTFKDARGQRVGEVQIVVESNGRTYTINGERHLAFSNSAEANDDDKGEEDQQH